MPFSLTVFYSDRGLLIIINYYSFINDYYSNIRFTNLHDFTSDGFYKGRYNISPYFSNDDICSWCVSL